MVRTYANVAATSADPTPAESAAARSLRQTGPALALQGVRLTTVEETLAGVVRELAALRAEVALLRTSGTAQDGQPPARAPPVPAVPAPAAVSTSTAVGDDCFYSGNSNMEGCRQYANCMIYMKSKGAKPKYRSVCPECRHYAVIVEGFARDYVEE